MRRDSSAVRSLLVPTMFLGVLLAGCQEERAPVAVAPEGDAAADRAVGEEVAADAVIFPVAGGGELVLERSGPDQVRLGEEYSYTLQVTNRSERPVSNVVINQVSPGEVEIVSATIEGQQQGQQQKPQGQQGQQPQQAQQQPQQAQQQPQGQQQPRQMAAQGQQGQQWNLGTLAPGESKTLQLTGVARSEGPLQSCMTLDYEPVLCAGITAVKPELTLTRAVVQEGEAVEQVYLCDEFAIAYQVTNAGTGTTEPVTIVEDLPQGLVTAEGSSRIALELGALKAGETVTEMVPLVAKQTMAFEGYAVARTGQLSARSERDAVQIVRPDIELAVDGPRQEYIGRPVNYQVTVRNTSEVPALATELLMNLPEGIENVSLSTQRAQQEGNRLILGELDPGETRQFQVSFDPVEEGKLQSSFAVGAYCAEAAKEQLVTQAVGIPAVLLEVVDQVDPVPVGESTVYSVRVKNQGTAPDLNVQVTAQLPNSLEFVRAEGETRVQADGNRIQFQPIGTLQPGQSAEWNIIARATRPTKARFNLELMSEANEQPITETELTTLY